MGEIAKDSMHGVRSEGDAWLRAIEIEHIVLFAHGYKHTH